MAKTVAASNKVQLEGTEYVAYLISTAEGDAGVADAVRAAIRLPREDVSPELSEWLKNNIAALGRATSAVEKLETDSTGHADDLAEQLKEARKTAQAAKRAADAARAERVVDTYLITEVHTVISKRELAKLWGISENVIGQLTAAGRVAVQLNVSKPADVSALVEGAKNFRSVMLEAAKEDKANLATVKAAIDRARDEKKNEKKAVPAGQPQKVSLDEALGKTDTPAHEANSVGRRFAALLDMLAQNGEDIATIGNVSGDEIVKRVRRALSGYEAAVSRRAAAEREAVEA